MFTIKKEFMKNKLKLLVLTIGVVGLLASCKKTFFTDANVNPNSPETVTPATLLSTVEGALAYTQGGDMSRYTQYFTQQTLGAFNQSSAYYTYVVTSQDIDNLWGNLYTSVMLNTDTLIRISDAKGFNRYSGIGRILMAYSLQITVDFWGDIPYSQAFKGLLQLNAAYDKGSDLYTTIGTLIDAGIAQLNNSSAGLSLPGSEDVIYGGSVAKWIKFGHAIKARLYLHQSKGNTTMATQTLNEIALAFASNSDNAQYIFGSAATANNPVFQFNDQRAYTDYPSGTLAGMMDGLADPRYLVYFDSTYNDYDGVGTGEYYGSETSPVELITYDELQFAKAEATIRSGGTVAAAQVIYANAITSNMKKLGVDDADIATYLLANGTLPASTTDAIAKIATQAYIALYLNPEAWTTWRRTGSPTLTPVAGTAIPRRLLYPLSELNYNKANTPASTLFTPRIFWDN